MGQSSNPLRNIARQSKGGPSSKMGPGGLIIDGVYHVDSLVRPSEKTTQQIAPPPGFSGTTTLESLKLSNARTPKKSGWISPQAFAEAPERETPVVPPIGPIEGQVQWGTLGTLSWEEMGKLTWEGLTGE